MPNEKCETEDLQNLYTAILPVYVTLLVQQLRGKLGELLLIDLTKFNVIQVQLNMFKLLMYVSNLETNNSL